MLMSPMCWIPLPAGVVVGIVCRRDLHRPGAQFLVRQQRIGDDRDEPAVERDADLLPHEVRVALVGRMDADGRVAEHRFGPRGREADDFVGVVPRLIDDG